MGCCQGSKLGLDISMPANLKGVIEGAELLEAQMNSRVSQSIADSKALVNGEMGQAVMSGVRRSATLITDQAKLLSKNLQEAVSAIQDLNLKKRVTDILCPVLRKFFVHSVNCDIESKYQIFEVIGKGGFSTVCRAKHIDSNTERAIKIIVKSTVSESQTAKLVDEIEALKAVGHPNIIHIVEVIEDVSKLCIVTELCTGGELFEKILNSKNFDEKTAAFYMFQLLSGLIHIHKNGYIHRDLKPENILFVDSSEESLLKIIDFGISKSTSDTVRQSTCSGTVYLI